MAGLPNTTQATGLQGDSPQALATGTPLPDDAGVNPGTLRREVGLVTGGGDVEAGAPGTYGAITFYAITDGVRPALPQLPVPVPPASLSALHAAIAAAGAPTRTF